MNKELVDRELDDLIKEAYMSLPEKVRNALLFQGKDFRLGAKLVSPSKTNGYVVQFLTFADFDASGKAIEKGVVWMFPGAEIKPHPHMTDSECYQEVTKDGFLLNGNVEKFVICKPGESHQAEATKNGTCIAWEWHEDGNNLNFVPQLFQEKNGEAHF